VLVAVAVVVTGAALEARAADLAVMAQVTSRKQHHGDKRRDGGEQVAGMMAVAAAVEVVMVPERVAGQQPTRSESQFARAEDTDYRAD
jgi:hypothetical protein